VLLPVGRFIGPELRFLWERLTPGELGLELTTSLAIGGVGIYFFVLFTVVLSSDPGPTVLDAEWFDLADKLQTSAGIDIAKAVSALGALPTALGLVLGTSILLALQRRPIEVVALLVAFGVIVVGVHATKAGVDRPRPDGVLVRFTGSSYPSGHAAYSAAWVAAAFLLTRRQGIASRATLVLVALAISAAIGVSRIYLHVHFWSDVAGGWGLGYGIFGVAGVIVLVIVYVRHNERAGAITNR
jgi:membrane-associated phospholipid phosphatase